MPLAWRVKFTDPKFSRLSHVTIMRKSSDESGAKKRDTETRTPSAEENLPGDVPMPCVQGWVLAGVTLSLKIHFRALKSVQACSSAPVDGIRAQDRPFSFTLAHQRQRL